MMLLNSYELIALAASMFILGWLVAEGVNCKRRDQPMGGTKGKWEDSRITRVRAKCEANGGLPGLYLGYMTRWLATVRFASVISNMPAKDRETLITMLHCLANDIEKDGLRSRTALIRIYSATELRKNYKSKPGKNSQTANYK